MRRKNWIALPLLFSALAFVSGCVTVNVNIPEGAIQKASDDYVRELYEEKEKEKTDSARTEGGAGAASSSDDLHLIQISGPKANEIKKRLKARRTAVRAQKQSGMLGETNEGILVIKGKPNGDEEKKKVQKLVDDENTDRKDLFKEIMRENHQPSSHLKTIEHSFARAFQDHSPAGTWVQDEDGDWSQKQ